MKCSVYCHGYFFPTISYEYLSSDIFFDSSVCEQSIVKLYRHDSMYFPKSMKKMTNRATEYFHRIHSLAPHPRCRLRIRNRLKLTSIEFHYLAKHNSKATFETRVRTALISCPYEIYPFLELPSSFRAQG
jgi:hypothetical protein